MRKVTSEESVLAWAINVLGGTKVKIGTGRQLFPRAWKASNQSGSNVGVNARDSGAR